MTSSALIEKLCQDLQPVRPVRPLREVALGLIALWLLIGFAVVSAIGIRRDLLEQVGGPGFLSILAALSFMAAGGITAALAFCIPGRETAARSGLGLATSGLVATLALTLVPIFGDASPGYIANSLLYDMLCLSVSIVLALPVVGAIIVFCRRAATWSAAGIATAAGLGAVAGGALLVHLVCEEDCARHLLGAHALAPVLGSLSLALPAYLMLRRQEPELH